MEAMTNMFYTGKVRNVGMRKRDFRKTIQITGLSIISSIIVAVIAFFIEFEYDPTFVEFFLSNLALFLSMNNSW
jgi:hypothetical protein